MFHLILSSRSPLENRQGIRSGTAVFLFAVNQVFEPRDHINVSYQWLPSMYAVAIRDTFGSENLEFAIFTLGARIYLDYLHTLSSFLHIMVCTKMLLVYPDFHLYFSLGPHHAPTLVRAFRL